MKVVISITVSPETATNNSNQITDPRDLNKQPESANLTISNYYYPGGVTSLTKVVSQWIEEHKGLDTITFEKVQKAKALEDYLNESEKKDKK